MSPSKLSLLSLLKATYGGGIQRITRSQVTVGTGRRAHLSQTGLVEYSGQTVAGRQRFDTRAFRMRWAVWWAAERSIGQRLRSTRLIVHHRLSPLHDHLGKLLVYLLDVRQQVAGHQTSVRQILAVDRFSERLNAIARKGGWKRAVVRINSVAGGRNNLIANNDQQVTGSNCLLNS